MMLEFDDDTPGCTGSTHLLLFLSRMCLTGRLCCSLPLELDPLSQRQIWSEWPLWNSTAAPLSDWGLQVLLNETIQSFGALPVVKLAAFRSMSSRVHGLTSWQ
jgi:hypothetical protein